jgi:hypothetical protein
MTFTKVQFMKKPDLLLALLVPAGAGVPDGVIKTTKPKICSRDNLCQVTLNHDHLTINHISSMSFLSATNEIVPTGAGRSMLSPSHISL